MCIDSMYDDVMPPAMSRLRESDRLGMHRVMN